MSTALLKDARVRVGDAFRDMVDKSKTLGTVTSGSSISSAVAVRWDGWESPVWESPAVLEVVLDGAPPYSVGMRVRAEESLLVASTGYKKAGIIKILRGTTQALVAWDSFEAKESWDDVAFLRPETAEDFRESAKLYAIGGGKKDELAIDLTLRTLMEFAKKMILLAPKPPAMGAIYRCKGSEFKALLRKKAEDFDQAYHAQMRDVLLWKVEHIANDEDLSFTHEQLLSELSWGR